MCGRFSQNLQFDDLVVFFRITSPHPAIAPRYNIAPSQLVAAVRVEQGERRLVMLRWGLIPQWVDDLKIGNKMINARGETVHKLPSFRAAYRKRRCIIPAGGFFEWLTKGKEKQPYYIYRQDGAPMALAGLWEQWHGEAQDQIESCSIVTTAANALVGQLHNRMPVVLDPNQFHLWLNPDEDNPKSLSPLLDPAEENVLVMYPVSSYVNKPQNEGERCIEQVERDA